MEKKYQIFISSTYKDLKKAREKVISAILSMYHFPVGMEMFGACDEDQWSIIKKDIDDSDYYILIIGKSFGSEVPGEGISYTQKEFRYAVAKGIPVLAFIKKDDAETSHTFQETDSIRIDKLQNFKQEIMMDRTVAYWSNEDELVWKVETSLEKQIKRKPRPGWVRAEKISKRKSINDSTILISNREQKLIDYLKENPNSTMKEIACHIGVTLPAAKHIILEMEENGLISRKRNGNRYKWTVND